MQSFPIDLRVLSISQWSMKAEDGTPMAGGKLVVFGDPVSDTNFYGIRTQTIDCPPALFTQFLQVPLDRFPLLIPCICALKPSKTSTGKPSTSITVISADFSKISARGVSPAAVPAAVK